MTKPILSPDPSHPLGGFTVREPDMCGCEQEPHSCLDIEGCGRCHQLEEHLNNLIKIINHTGGYMPHEHQEQLRAARKMLEPPHD